MHTKPEIFKAYDIRGVYGDQLTDESGYRLGRAFGMFLKKEYPTKETPLKVVVGRDMRESGVHLEATLRQGLADEGIQIISVGLSSTPMMYYSVLECQADGGIVITASHNPAEYNGFKLVKGKSIPISGETGIYEMRDLVMNDEVMQRPETSLPIVEEYRPEIMDTYVASAMSFRDQNIDIKPMTVVVDTANGMAAPLIEKFFAHFPQIRLIHLFPELDGTFPNHEANPLKEETLEDLKEAIIENQADFGVACDGDFDRVSFVDNTGRTARPDITTALLTPTLIAGMENVTILYDLRSSNITPETIEAHGARAVQTRVGHSFIKSQMREEKAFFAGEFSGHFYLNIEKDGTQAYFENPLFMLVEMLEFLSEQEKTLAEIADPYFVYHHTGEINFEVERPKEEIMAEIKQELSDGEISELDGIRADFENGWILVRASNTEPVLRLIVEGRTESDMQSLRDRAQKVIMR